MYLNKSTFVDSKKCAKRTWLRINTPDLFLCEKVDMEKIRDGNEVGDAAKRLFDDVDVVPFASNEIMEKETLELLKKGSNVIAEATFIFNNLLCRVDYLEICDDGLIINEVKAKTSVRKKRKDKGVEYDAELLPEYRWDAGFQYYVLKKAGYNIKRVNYIYLNSDYHKDGEIDYSKLFKVDDCTAEIIEYYRNEKDNIEKDIAYVLDVINSKEDPGDFLLCGNCKDNTTGDCIAISHCRKHLPTPNVWDLSGNCAKKKWYQDGLYSFEELRNAGVLNNKQKDQVETELSGNPIIHEQELADFLKELKFPLYFFDFESFKNAIPRYDGDWPYGQITFQYSLDIVEEAGAPIIHKEFLAEEGKDPKREISEQIIKDIGESGSVIVYHDTFEKGRLEELAELFPDLADRLLQIIDRIVDIEIPFKKHHYYLKEMKGKSSIKLVLPALFPDNPGLDYKKLPGVKKGDEAAALFNELETMDETDRFAQREYLLRYCSLDTFAMVKVWEKLLQLTGDNRYEQVAKANDDYEKARDSHYEEMDSKIEKRKGNHLW